MLKTIQQRLGRDDEQGFTLIELMVVVLIIAILLAIAIPTFLGARNSANARGAQSNLRNALTAEQTYWTNNQAFSADATAGGALASIENSLNWTTTSPVSTNPANSVLVGIDASANPGTQWVELTAMGKDNNCYSVAQVNVPFTSGANTIPAGTYYDQTALTAGACAAPAFTPTGGPAAGSAHNQVGTWSQSF
jgi:type IV pilus assembly protein PilA